MTVVHRPPRRIHGQRIRLSTILITIGFAGFSIYSRFVSPEFPSGILTADRPFCNDCRDVLVEEWDPQQNQSTALSNEYFFLTYKGQKGIGLPNQDAAGLLVGSTDFLALLADGHGPDGHFVARQVVQGLRAAMLGHSFIDESSLTDAFRRVDQVVLQLNTSKDGGSTTVLALRHQKRLYLATTGDSVAFVVANGNLVAESVKHKPDLPEERQRIASKGGIVMDPQGPGDSSRVLISEMALAMSRSFGDRDGKDLGYLVVDPAIQSLGATEAPSFLVVASDGVFDYLSPTEAAQELSLALERQQLGAACRSIFQRAANLWSLSTGGQYRDDMTLVVMRL